MTFRSPARLNVSALHDCCLAFRTTERSGVMSSMFRIGRTWNCMSGNDLTKKPFMPRLTTSTARSKARTERCSTWGMMDRRHFIAARRGEKRKTQIGTVKIYGKGLKRSIGDRAALRGFNG